ncbi:hypothetical protein M0R89_06065 [Halorussus limi]|uniref:Uncharacterized protein n=2 Tax=Halorussus TaxID=1070314 RepID=A0A8U0INW4_9EURY|nr:MULTISPECIES: hypothetical protein [Halorussus]UPV75627.1 hypothetical protein M0R89_06065 [Halorussus limi]UPW01699.1 hypothetical protein M0R88_06250 [Halorussus gelatinilyticus]
MGDLAPVAFDIETSGLQEGSVVTVAGFSHQLRNWLVLNTQSRPADRGLLRDELGQYTNKSTELRVVDNEEVLLQTLAQFVDEAIDGDMHYLTAYNGEVWKGGFDLPFLRSACLRNDIPWPFREIPYADMMDAISRFDTNDVRDLVGVYDMLIGDVSYDPFDDSKAAVTAFEQAEWAPLLRHNLADIERTRELAELAGRYVPRSDFSMKNLAPPDIQ